MAERELKLAELGELLFGLARQRRPRVLQHGRDWRVRRIGSRVVFTSPEGVSYVQAEPAAEPDVVIRWKRDRMVMPDLRLRVYDVAKLERKLARKERVQEQVARQRRVRRKGV